jgi:hypothetical protein
MAGVSAAMGAPGPDPQRQGAGSMSDVPVDLPEMVAEARHELLRRQQQFPALIREGRLNARLGARQIDRMQAIYDLLCELNNSPKGAAYRRAA